MFGYFIENVVSVSKHHQSSLHSVDPQIKDSIFWRSYQNISSSSIAHTVCMARLEWGYTCMLDLNPRVSCILLDTIYYTRWTMRPTTIFIFLLVLFVATYSSTRLDKHKTREKRNLGSIATFALVTGSVNAIYTTSTGWFDTWRQIEIIICEILYF